MTPRARYLAHVNGRPVYRFPVEVTLVDMNNPFETSERWTSEVTAYSAREAANWVRDEFPYPGLRVVAYGPKGGQTVRYVSVEQAVWKALQNQSTGQRIAWQAALGSDPVRELLSAIRHYKGDPHPTLFVEASK